MNQEDNKEKENSSAASAEETKDQNQDSKSGSTSGDGIDYKAELDGLKKQLDQAGHVIETLKRDKKDETIPPIDEDQIVERVAQQLIPQITKTVQAGEAKRLASQRASSPEEAALILWHYEHSIVPTGDIEADIDNARVLANKKRFVNDLNAATRAAQSKSNRSGDSGDSGQKQPAKNDLKLTHEEERFTRPPYNLTPEEIIKNRN